MVSIYTLRFVHEADQEHMVTSPSHGFGAELVNDIFYRHIIWLPE
jgi:hypothetical protein